MENFYRVLISSFLSKTARGAPETKVPKKFVKIYAVVIEHNRKKVKKFLARLMLNLQKIQTFDGSHILSMLSRMSAPSFVFHPETPAY